MTDTLLRAVSHAHGAEPGPVPFDIVVMAHDERHLRRKLLTLRHGGKLLVDLPSAVQFADGDRLVLEDGRQVEIVAAKENLFEIIERDPVRHAELCWHIGNRHLAAQIEADRILILRDPPIGAMLVGLGAQVREVSESFHPARGAYLEHVQDHSHEHSNDRQHGRAHERTQRRAHD